MRGRHTHAHTYSALTWHVPGPAAAAVAACAFPPRVVAAAIRPAPGVVASLRLGVAGPGPAGEPSVSDVDNIVFVSKKPFDEEGVFSLTTVPGTLPSICRVPCRCSDGSNSNPIVTLTITLQTFSVYGKRLKKTVRRTYLRGVFTLFYSIYLSAR